MKFDRTVLSALSLALIASAVSINAALADALSPKETYLKYRAALASAKKVDEIQPFLCKKVNEQINKTPADDKPVMFGFMKETTPVKVQVLSEDIKGDNATLKLTSTGDTGNAKNATETSKGSVTFVKENGEWKMDKESWDIKMEFKD